MNAGNVPRALQWVPSASLIKQAFEGLCDNEFPGLRFEPQSADGSGDVVQGEQVCCVTHADPVDTPNSDLLTTPLAYMWRQPSSRLASLGRTSNHPVLFCYLGSTATRNIAHSRAYAAPCCSCARDFPQVCNLWTQVLQRLGFEQSTVSKTMRAQTRILLFNYWATYCILKAKKPNFQPMEPVAA